MKKVKECIVFLSLGISFLLLNGCGNGGDGDNQEGKAPAQPSESGVAKDRVTLRTEIPPERIEGTPTAMEIPNLEKAPEKAPAIQVPAGTSNLALGKEVTSSDTFPIIGDISLITDGDKQAGEGYYVELMDGPQWVQIDLEQEARIYGVWVWHYHSQQRAYHDVILQITNDPEFKEGVVTVFNNDYDNSAGMGKGKDRPYVESRFGKLIAVDGVTGRYVRLYSKGNTSNDMNHYIEVEVHGTPVE